MMSSSWTPTTKRALVIGLTILALVGLWLIRPILAPILIGIVLAYLLKPLVDVLERRARFPRLAAVIVVFLVLLAVIAVVPATIIPRVVGWIQSTVGDLQGIVDDVSAFLSKPVVIFRYQFVPQELLGNLPGTLQTLFPYATRLSNLLLGLASSLFWTICTLIITFYLVKDAGRLRSFLDRMAPAAYRDELAHLREQISMVWSRFFRGQLLLCLAIGLATWICMSIIGLPYAGLMGLIAGVLEAIPNFGPAVATFIIVLVALFRGSTYLHLTPFWFAVLVIGINVVLQQIENAYLVPRVLGDRMRVHPVIIFIGILVGGYLFGGLGILLAAPLLGTFRVLMRYGYFKLLDQNPFEEPAQEVLEPVSPRAIDAVFLDLDGTLVAADDQAVARLAARLEPLRRILPKANVVGIARRLVIAADRVATTISGFLERFGPWSAASGLTSRLQRLRGLPELSNSRPEDGVSEMLHELSRRYRLAVVTTRNSREVEAFVRQQGWSELIQAITGRENTWRIKPHPGPVLHTARRLGVPAKRCLMVGDSADDIRAARAAGARAAGVLCGFGQKDELELAGADLILDRTAELKSWL